MRDRTGWEWILAAALLLGASRAARAQDAPADHIPPGGDASAAISGDSVPGTDAMAIVVELRIGRLVSRTVQALRAGDDILLPVGELLDLAEIAHHSTPDGRLQAEPAQHAAPLIIDAARDSMCAGSRCVAVDRSRRLQLGGELYVASAPLGDLLGVHFAVDWQELVVTLLDPDQLPVARRVARDEARQRFAERRDARALTRDFTLDAARPAIDGLVLDYDLSAQGSDVLHTGRYALSLGADLLGGSLEGSLSSMGALGTGRTRGTLSWTGVWSSASLVRQLRLGDALATGPSPRPMRGIALGNAPYLRLTDFGTADFTGAVEPGWLVEAYRGGELIAFDSTNAAGGFGLQIPVEYGDNAVDLVAYGPYGEMRTFDRVYRIPGELIPARHFEYGASVGACTAFACRATGNLDLRYGLSSRWTVRGGVEQFWRDTLADLVQPYASISGALTNAWNVELSAMARADAQATVRYEPSLGVRLTAQYARYATDVVTPILSPAGWRSSWSATALVRPLGVRSAFYLDARAQQIETTTGSMVRAQLGTSVQRGGVRVMPYVRAERNVSLDGSAQTRPYVGVSAFVLPLERLGPMFGQLWWRGTIEAASATRLASLSTAVSGPLGNAVRAEFGAVWMRGMPGPSFTLTFSADRGKLRSYTTLSAQQGTTPGVTQAIEVSLLVDRATHDVMLVPGPSLQRAGIAGRVFLDANGNGKWDPDETALSDVHLRVGPQTVVTDSSGTFRVWDVVPFEPVRVTVDSMSLASPLWAPLFDDLNVVPSPNRFQVMDIPIEPGAEIDGRVLQQSGSAVTALPGVRVALTNRQTGRVYTATTFSDGTYVVLGAAPGRYEVAVDSRDLVELHSTAGTVSVDVPADVNGARVGANALTVRAVLAAR
ncbi:MAG TPA: carboxypeptidase regulatory-like domain-containing protein [Gemmatimonadaceae bacterium]